MLVVGIVFAIGYGALYEADADRDVDTEAEVAGIPVRFVSLMCVALGSVAILAVAFRPRTRSSSTGDSAGRDADGGHPDEQKPSLRRDVQRVGAATADSAF